MHAARLLFPLLVLTLAAGCATATSDGRRALYEGRYLDAIQRFERVLAAEPDNLTALVGIGVAKYRLGYFEDAVDALADIVTRAPQHVTARLYLALAHVRRGADALAVEHLQELARATAGSRTAAQIDRALGVLQGAPPVSPDLRAFVAASIEHSAELERQLRETQVALRDAEFYRYAAAPIPIIIKRGRAVHRGR